MSIGIHYSCPNCWEDMETCKCSEEDMDVYYKRIKTEQEKIKEFGDAKHLHPIWKAWKEYKENI